MGRPKRAALFLVRAEALKRDAQQIIRDLEQMSEKLLEDVRNLPPGPDRHELLKEIGRVYVKVDALKQRHFRTKVAGHGDLRSGMARSKGVDGRKVSPV
jgi:hypothetical protein